MIGISREVIDQFLGTPGNPEGYFEGWDCVYWLRADASYLDNEWLVVKTDPHGIVTEAAIITD